MAHYSAISLLTLLLTVPQAAVVISCDSDSGKLSPPRTDSVPVGVPGGGTGGTDTPPKPPAKVVTETITLDDERFELEIAASPDAITKGLSGRESIPDDGGMLFIFRDSQVRHFWMLDCLVDIDIIYVDAVGGVTAVHRMKADPQLPDESRTDYQNRLRKYSSISRAQFAIELQAGSLDRLGIKAGDRLTHIDWRRIRRHAN